MVTYVRYAVTVQPYSLDEGKVGEICAPPVHHSYHWSGKNAARKLASLIAGRTAYARHIRQAIGRNGSRWTIFDLVEGKGYSLNQFRKTLAS